MKRPEENGYKKYGWFDCILYNLRSSWKWNRMLFICQLLPVIPNVAATYLGVLLPAEMVRGLEEHWDIRRLILHIFVLVLGICLMRMVDEAAGNYVWGASGDMTLYYEKLCYHKIMELDYDMLEEPKSAKLIGNTWNVLRNSYGLRDALLAIPMGLGDLLGVVWYGIMIGRANVIIIFLAVVNALISMKLLAIARKKHEKLHEKMGSCTRETAYISKQSMDRSAGKDIRIYRMADWFLRKYDEPVKGMEGILRKIRNGYFLSVSADAVTAFVLNCFSYIYLITILLKGEITVSVFVLYVGLIRHFSDYFIDLMNQIVTLDPLKVSINYVRNFLEMEESRGWAQSPAGTGDKAEGWTGSGDGNMAEGRTGSRSGKTCPAGGLGPERISRIMEEGIRVEFRGVSFHYPEKEESALSDISLVIRPGERLALIGLNGAGKTTLAKLLCGFYKPTKGEILINDIPLSRFGREEYFSLLSVLFQDTTFLPVSLDYNLTSREPEEIDRKRLELSLRLSGSWEKYQSLPKKGDTLLVREVNGDAVDFSGGERQKLLFARALYKKARLMILDEPTAALDPIAENDMYIAFSKAAVGRTCLYISHRLSSTRFCDRIILMEHGRIVEEGTHDTLMAKGGRYADLYEMQSRYYREQEEEKARQAFLNEIFE